MAQPRRANRTPAAGRRPPAGSPVFGPCFACETRKPSFQACPLRMFWPNRPPVKGSSQAAPAGSQGAALSASSGGCQTPERRGVCAGTSPPRGKRSAQQHRCEGVSDWRRSSIETPHGGSTRRAKARCPAPALGRPSAAPNSCAHSPEIQHQNPGKNGSHFEKNDVERPLRHHLSNDLCISVARRLRHRSGLTHRYVNKTQNPMPTRTPTLPANMERTNSPS